ncbi:MAG: hypothetical protein AB8H79_05325 [Myxococcota bacterium]
MMWLLTVLAYGVPQTGAVCEGPLDLALDAPRPQLSGDVRTWDSRDGAYRVHWTDSGADAAPLDAQGVPILRPMIERAWADTLALVGADGWRPLIGDDGTGGSDALDLYVVDIDANGYANALSPPDGETGASCFVRLDPNISALGADIAESVVRHELVHCLQFRYATEADSWLYEASATFEQFRPSGTVSGLRFPLAFLWTQRLGSPDLPLFETGDRFEYAGFVWFKFVEEAYGVKPAQVWQALEADPRWQTGVQAALGEVSIGDAFALHSAYNVHSCERASELGYRMDDNAHCTATGASAPLRELDDPFVEVEALVPWTSVSSVVQPVALDSADAPEGGVGEALVECSVSRGRVSVVVTDRTPTVRMEPWSVRAEEPAWIPVDLPSGSAVVVVASTGDEPADAFCRVTWAPVERGCGCASPSLPGPIWAVLLGMLMIRRRR